MRRSNSVRKAIYALVVLAIFMVFLRISRSDELPQSPVPAQQPAAPHHNAQDAVAQKPSFADDKPADAAKPAGKVADKPADKPVDRPEAVKPAEKEPSKAKAGAGKPKEKETDAEKSLYDAKKAFEGMVHSKDSPPVVIFSKSYCPHSMRAKKLLLEAHTIDPTPKVIELDQIDHGAELQKYIGEITERHTVPNILINGVSRGGASDLIELEDTLVTRFLEWGEGKLTITKVEAAVQAADQDHA